MATMWKVSKYGVISGPSFSAFGLNTGIYCVNPRIQSEYRKIRTRNNSVSGHFSLSGRDIRDITWIIIQTIKETSNKRNTQWHICYQNTAFRLLFWVPCSWLIINVVDLYSLQMSIFKHFPVHSVKYEMEREGWILVAIFAFFQIWTTYARWDRDFIWNICKRSILHL